ncbi:Uncharacterized protein TCM_024251 [Theobroma cacao]|uniref:Reverse transcriptase Ty1/copia-type domain-containing protein n=1 Tax=Theobroma cacao TaxID=3641 RepID=A0A061EWZ4_THECC|nr:Uncharacterized protein TCM_024251 [Theobroma cacao]
MRKERGVGMYKYSSDHSINCPHLIPYSCTTSIPFTLYVDDLLVTSNNTEVLHQFLQHLANKFYLKDLGNLNYFLGIEAISTSNGLFNTSIFKIS